MAADKSNIRRTSFSHNFFSVKSDELTNMGYYQQSLYLDCEVKCSSLAQTQYPVMGYCAGPAVCLIDLADQGNTEQETVCLHYVMPQEDPN